MTDSEETNAQTREQLLLVRERDSFLVTGIRISTFLDTLSWDQGSKGITS